MSVLFQWGSLKERDLNTFHRGLWLSWMEWASATCIHCVFSFSPRHCHNSLTKRWWVLNCTELQARIKIHLHTDPSWWHRHGYLEDFLFLFPRDLSGKQHLPLNRRTKQHYEAQALQKPAGNETICPQNCRDAGEVFKYLRLRENNKTATASSVLHALFI